MVVGFAIEKETEALFEPPLPIAQVNVPVVSKSPLVNRNGVLESALPSNVATISSALNVVQSADRVIFPDVGAVRLLYSTVSEKVEPAPCSVAISVSLVEIRVS